MKKCLSISLILIFFLLFVACNIDRDEKKTDNSPEIEVASGVQGSTVKDIASSLGQNTDAIYSRELLISPDPTAKVQNAVKSGSRVFILAESSDKSLLLWSIDGETRQFQYLPLPDEMEIWALTPGRTDYCSLICVDKTGKYCLLWYDGQSWNSQSLESADDDTGIFAVYEVDGGYVVFTGAKTLVLDSQANLIKDLGSCTQGICLPTQNGCAIVRRIKGGPDMREVTETILLDNGFSITERFESQWIFDLIQQSPGLDGFPMVNMKGSLFAFNYQDDSLVALMDTERSGLYSRQVIALGEKLFMAICEDKVCLYRPETDTSDAVLTMAGYQLPQSITDYVRLYNESGRDYRIQILDYAAYDSVDAQGRGLEKFRTDILSGNVPDIYELTNLPAQLYAHRGLLMDLKTLLNGNNGPSYQALDSNAIKALEYEGGLYYLTPSYQILSLCTGESFAKNTENWTAKDFFAAAEGFSPVEILGPDVSQEQFMTMVMVFLSQDYIDAQSQSCCFDSGEFAKFIDFACDLNANPLNDGSMPAARAYVGQQLVLTEQIGVSAISFMAFDDAAFGVQSRYMGFPSNRGGSGALIPDCLVGISATCAQQQGAADFLSFILDESLQSSVADFPLLSSALDNCMNRWQQQYEQYPPVLYSLFEGATLNIEGSIDPQVAKERLRNIMASIDCCANIDSSLLTLVLRECQPCFSGNISPQNAAQNIQSKVSIYLAEQYS